MLKSKALCLPLGAPAWDPRMHTRRKHILKAQSGLFALTAGFASLGVTGAPQHPGFPTRPPIVPSPTLLKPRVINADIHEQADALDATGTVEDVGELVVQAVVTLGEKTHEG